MLTISINSVFEYIDNIGCYFLTRQTVPVVDNPISKVTFMQIILICDVF